MNTFLVLVEKIRIVGEDEIHSDEENLERMRKPNILKRKYIIKEFEEEKENVKNN